MSAGVVLAGYNEILVATPENIRGQLVGIYMENKMLPENMLQLWNVCALDRRTNNDLEEWHLRYIN